MTREEVRNHNVAMTEKAMKLQEKAWQLMDGIRSQEYATSKDVLCDMIRVGKIAESAKRLLDAKMDAGEFESEQNYDHPLRAG